MPSWFKDYLKQLDMDKGYELIHYLTNRNDPDIVTDMMLLLPTASQEENQ